MTQRGRHDFRGAVTGLLLPGTCAHLLATWKQSHCPTGSTSPLTSRQCEGWKVDRSPSSGSSYTKEWGDMKVEILKRGEERGPRKRDGTKKGKMQRPGHSLA